MKKLIGFIIIINCLISQMTLASMSLSCSGSVALCSNCTKKYYYIYAYQYAYVYKGEVQNESHNFSMSGFLDDSNSYKIQGTASNRHVFYSNGQYILAIPYQDRADGIWVNGLIHTNPGEAPVTWIRLCPNLK